MITIQRARPKLSSRSFWSRMCCLRLVFMILIIFILSLCYYHCGVSCLSSTDLYCIALLFWSLSVPPPFWLVHVESSIYSSVIVIFWSKHHHHHTLQPLAPTLQPLPPTFNPYPPIRNPLTPFIIFKGYRGRRRALFRSNPHF
jgi:hypothetical protein